MDPGQGLVMQDALQKNKKITLFSQKTIKDENETDKQNLSTK